MKNFFFLIVATVLVSLYVVHMPLVPIQTGGLTAHLLDVAWNNATLLMYSNGLYNHFIDLADSIFKNLI